VTSFVKGVKLWIVMEYLGGGSCLDLVCSMGVRQRTRLTNTAKTRSFQRSPHRHHRA
jgi:serine/threonine protein kinase